MISLLEFIINILSKCALKKDLIAAAKNGQCRWVKLYDDWESLLWMAHMKLRSEEQRQGKKHFK
jgi:hypothetical protein